MDSKRRPKVLFFDVFGTCVNWRKTVTDHLWKTAREVLGSSSSTVSPRIREAAAALTYQHWGAIAQEWRWSYLAFTAAIAKDPSIPYKTVDQHHLEALHTILIKYELIVLADGGEISHGSLWNESQLQAINLIWHRLEPWPDSVAGLAALNDLGLVTSTLSNGNISLLQDMVSNGKMPFTQIYSAEMFNSYKPNAKVYLGGAAKMGLQPSECCMVAAHLDDLKFAKSNGFRTIYVERLWEEGHPELRDEEGIVDIWVTEEEEGFVEAARKLKSSGIL